MAFGVILIDLKPGYNVDLMSYLFGNILMVTKADLWMMLGVGVTIIVVLTYFYNDYLALSYDEEFARIRGVNVKALYFLLIGLLAVSIVMIIRMVGLILVIALLTIPPFIAEKYSRSLWMMMIYSGILSSIFIITGLWLSYGFNLTSGATIIMVAGAGFLTALVVERWRSKILKRSALRAGE